MEAANADGVDGCASKLLLAARAGCELGAGLVLSRAACDAGLGLSTRLSGNRAAVGLFPHPSSSRLADAALAAVAPASSPAVPRASRAAAAAFLVLFCRVPRLLPHGRLRLRVLDRSLERRNVLLMEVGERQLLALPQFRNLLDGLVGFFFFDARIAAEIERLRGKG